MVSAVDKWPRRDGSFRRSTAGRLRGCSAAAVTLSFAQHRRRIEPCGATGWHPGGQDAHGNEHHCRAGKRQRVACPQVEQQRLHETRPPRGCPPGRTRGRPRSIRRRAGTRDARCWTALHRAPCAVRSPSAARPPRARRRRRGRWPPGAARARRRRPRASR